MQAGSKVTLQFPPKWAQLYPRFFINFDGKEAIVRKFPVAEFSPDDTLCVEVKGWEGEGYLYVPKASCRSIN
jgi:hypothetical protein